MRLINVKTLSLVDFSGETLPEYVILSHRWTHDELSFKEFRKGLRTDSQGYKKIADLCLTIRRISRENIKYVWVDTVCIDKRSSAELTESINSMWSYYEKSNLCLVYMSEVDGPGHGGNGPSGIADITDEARAQFMTSSWWGRGWTLQELLAPRRVVFLDSSWQIIGRKNADPISGLATTVPTLENLCDTIHTITQIPERVLQNQSPPESCSVAQRMSWASDRTTTRIEDVAYSLLGLFQINMPLIYGEGIKAFERLQLEIIKTSHDQSIFAWVNPKCWGSSLLANWPFAFKNSWDVVRRPSSVVPYAITNHGLEIRTEYKVLRWRYPGTRQEKQTYLVPMGFFARELGGTGDGGMICFIMLTLLECGHYGRILDGHFIWGPHPTGYTNGTLYVHASKCEDKGDLPTLQHPTADEFYKQSFFWNGAWGRKILEDMNISAVRR